MCLEATTKSVIPQKVIYLIIVILLIFQTTYLQNHVTFLYAITTLNSFFNQLNPFIFLFSFHKVLALNVSYKSREMKKK